MDTIRRARRSLGPGILMAMVAIGGSHLVLCPTAGAKYGFALLWIVLLAHVLKYPSFEFSSRYTLATGESIIAGYRRLPGPKDWGLYAILVMVGVFGICGVCAVISVTAAVLYAATGIPISISAVLIAIVAILLLLIGKYALLEKINKVMLAILMIVVFIAFFYSCPPPGSYSSFVIPVVPIGAAALMASLIGWLPSDMVVSLLYSTWAMEKWNGEKNNKEVLNDALLDVRVGYVIIFVLASMLLILGAMTLQPKGLVPEGEGVARTIAMVFTSSIGDWMYPLFMVVAFFIMFSTSYNGLDGGARLVSTTSGLLSERIHKRVNGFRSILTVFFGSIGAVIVYFIPHPVPMIMIAAIMGLFFAPLIYFMNVYCATKLIDKEMRPPKITVALSIAGILFTMGSVLFFISVMIM